AFGVIGVIVAPTSAAASAPVHHEEAAPGSCMRQGGPCARKDEGFTSYCCNNLTCRGGVCGGGSTSRAREVARDFFWVRFDRPAADLHQLRVAPELLDAVLAAVTVAAEHLDRGVGDFLRSGR